MRRENLKGFQMSDVRLLGALLQPEVECIAGGLFVGVAPAQRKKIAKTLAAFPERKAFLEDEQNRRTGEAPFHHRHSERLRMNFEWFGRARRALEVAVEPWRCELEPRICVTFGIGAMPMDEWDPDYYPDDPYERWIYPELRLWTAGPGADELDATYRDALAGRPRIAAPDGPTPFLDLEQLIALHSDLYWVEKQRGAMERLCEPFMHSMRPLSRHRDVDGRDSA